MLVRLRHRLTPLHRHTSGSDPDPDPDPGSDSRPSTAMTLWTLPAAVKLKRMGSSQAASYTCPVMPKCQSTTTAPTRPRPARTQARARGCGRQPLSTFSLARRQVNEGPPTGGGRAARKEVRGRASVHDVGRARGAGQACRPCVEDLGTDGRRWGHCGACRRGACICASGAARPDRPCRSLVPTCHNQPRVVW